MSEKKPWKKWTQEEMLMLVNGYQMVYFFFFLLPKQKLTVGHNYVGVGNWKTILQDPNPHVTIQP